MASRGIVFLPGLLCDEELWAAPAEALKDFGACSIADLTLDDSVHTMAQRVAASAPPEFVVVALSMGGYVAFELLRQIPERIAAVVLFDTSAVPDTPARAAQRQAGVASLAVGRFAGVTRRLLPQLIHSSHVDGPVGRRVREMALRVGKDAYIRQQRAILGRPDSRPVLSSFNVPTLVAVGQQDVLTPPEESQAIHQAVAHSQLHVFCECGHMPPVESAEETTLLLRNWLVSTGI